MKAAKFLLDFPLAKISEPVFTKLVTEFDVHPNVLAANVDAANGGWMHIRVDGSDDQIARAKAWIESTGITVNEVILE